MAATSQVNIRVGLDTAKLSRDMQKLSAQIGKGLKIASVAGVAALGALLVKGVKINSMFESMQIALAANLNLVNKDWAKSMTEAAALMRDLEQAALSTNLTFMELAQGFQALLGPMRSVGIQSNKTRVDIVTIIANLVKTLLPGQDPGIQLMQEGRALFRGEFGARAPIGSMLFPTQQEKDAWRAALKSGKAVEMLMKAVEGLRPAMIVAANSFEGLISNTKQALTAALRVASEPAFIKAKSSLLAIFEQVRSPEFIKGAEAISNVLQDVIDFVSMSLVNWVKTAGEFKDVLTGKESLDPGAFFRELTGVPGLDLPKRDSWGASWDRPNFNLGQSLSDLVNNWDISWGPKTAAASEKTAKLIDDRL